MRTKNEFFLPISTSYIYQIRSQFQENLTLKVVQTQFTLCNLLLWVHIVCFNDKKTKNKKFSQLKMAFKTGLNIQEGTLNKLSQNISLYVPQIITKTNCTNTSTHRHSSNLLYVKCNPRASTQVCACTQIHFTSLN